MTTNRPLARKPLAILGGIGFLVISHSWLEDTPSSFSRTLPFLLIMILGELVREWTVARLAPTVDEHVLRRRRHYQWLAMIAGIAFMAASIVGAVAEWWPKRGLWSFVLFAAGIIGLALSVGILLVRTQAAADAKRAEMARAGESPDRSPPGPLALLLVILVALVLFALANATAIEALFAQQALNSRQWVRVIVSAVLCGGLAFVALRKANEFADRPFSPSSPDPT